ncbi:nitroreductase family protein, partial [Actinocorallia lasiicapitis]
VLGATELSGGGDRLTATLRWGAETDDDLARDLPGLLTRHTNRNPGTGSPIEPAVLEALGRAARSSSGTVHSITAPDALAEAAVLLAASDRIRYLTPTLHAEMFAELRGPGDDLDTGLDLRTLELAPDELAKLAIGGRSEVMARVRAFGGGVALGEYTLDRVRSASALVAVCLPGAAPSLTDYARAGEAVQRVWIEAGRHGLAVQPMSPVFLYATGDADLREVAPGFEGETAALRDGLRKLLDVPATDSVGLVLRLGHAAPAAVRSGRREPRISRRRAAERP